MIIDQKFLARKLNMIKSVVPANATMNIIQGVMFKDNALTAYNLETGIRIPLDTETDESFVLPIKAIDLITKMPSGSIEITAADNNAVTIKSGKTKSRHSSFPADDFPDLPQVDEAGAERIVTDGSKLSDIISKVLYAVGDDESRPNLNGIIFKSRDGSLDLVGCDSNRLAWGKIDYQGDLGFIAPKFALQRLLKCGMSGETELLWSNHVAVFKTAGYVLVTRLIAGNIINYSAIYPKHENIIEVNRKELMGAVERAMVMIQHNPVKLKVAGQSITVMSNSDTGEYIDDVPLEAEAKQEVQLGVNGKYLLESLKNMDGSTVKIALGGSTEAISIQDRTTDLSALLMPVRM